MASVSELSMHQANALRLQQEVVYMISPAIQIWVIFTLTDEIYMQTIVFR